MFPILGIPEFKKDWNNLDNTYPFYGVILYTSEDKVVSDYVEKHWNDLHSLSGEYCLVFSFQNRTGKNYMNYDLANYFDLSYDNIPCLLLFHNSDKKNGLVIAFDSEKDPSGFTSTLRRTFDIIKDASKQSDSSIDYVYNNIKKNERMSKISKIVTKLPYGQVIIGLANLAIPFFLNKNGEKTKKRTMKELKEYTSSVFRV